MCGNKPLFTWGADTREEQSPARRLGPGLTVGDPRDPSDLASSLVQRLTCLLCLLPRGAEAEARV